MQQPDSMNKVIAKSNINNMNNNVRDFFVLID